MKEKLKEYWKHTVAILTKTEMGILPGQLAFFFIVAIIPLIAIIFLIANKFGISYNSVAHFVNKSVTVDVAKLIQPFLSHNTVDVKFTIFIIMSFIIASNAAHSIILASNIVFNLPNSKFLPRRIKSLILTIILLFLMVFLLLVPVFGQNIINIINWLGIDNNIIKTIELLLPYLKWPLTIFMIFFIVKIVYTIAPDAEIPSSYVNRGALFTTVFWIIATLIYSYYTTNIARYDLFYGALASIIVLMLWFYFMSYIFVIGLVLNYRNMDNYVEKTKEIDLLEVRKKLEKEKDEEEKKTKESTKKSK